MLSGPSQRRSWKTRLLAFLTLLIGGTCSPVKATPAEWREYAIYAGGVFHQSLAQEEDPAVQRLHQYMDKQSAGPTGIHPMVVRIWLDNRGNVARLSIPELGDPQARKDLTSILTDTRLNRAPPEGMPMPLLISLGLSYPDE